MDSRFIIGIEGLEEIVVYSSSRFVISRISTVGRVRSLGSCIVVGYRGLISYSNSREVFSKISVSLSSGILKRIRFSSGLDKLSITGYLATGFKGYTCEIILG